MSSCASMGKENTDPTISLGHEAIVVTLPDKLDAVLDQRREGSLVLQDGQLEPSPVPSGRDADVELVVRLCNELESVDFVNGIGSEGLRVHVR